ncbi:MAG: hypothetical protein HON77_04650, partial [Gammaproteobacteria bacterium]|nr:hypothetical protein [Gammaproteobacteria bacterium]
VFFPVQVYKNAIHQYGTLVVETLTQVALTQSLGGLLIVFNWLNAHSFSALRYADLMFMAALLGYLLFSSIVIDDVRNCNVA